VSALPRERRTASVGVDVDSLCHYYRIHGLDDAGATNAAWAVGVPRFLALFEELGIPATFYCVAEDLEWPDNAERMRQVVAAGHEIGNHTWHHRYDLTRMGAAERRAEVEEGRLRLERACGAPVVGFRSPGYNTTAALQADVAATGHVYDSSVFPCAPYYLAKAAVMGGMRLGGRRSRSVLGSPKVLSAPRFPYEADPEEPHRRGHRGLRQYPISVVAGAPLIGTAFTALGALGSAALGRAALAMPGHLTVEFHAADLLALGDDGLDPALAVQPDLRRPVKAKRRAFVAALAPLAARRRVVRLDALP
jgi:peptidoglycan-N-acetylglucosamine deacetylase